MQPITIQVFLETEDAFFPQKATPQSACYDLYSPIGLTIPPGGDALIPLGIRLFFIPGYFGKIYSRSGMGMKNQVVLLNGTGIIDSDYQGTLIIGLKNHHPNKPFIILRGQAIAQLEIVKEVASRLQEITAEEVVKITPTRRGTGGLGHTDKVRL